MIYYHRSNSFLALFRYETRKAAAFKTVICSSRGEVRATGMGRRKVEIKKIEDKNSRQVTFSKRRNGLMKKAKQLSVLCDADVAVLIFSCRGKHYQFCSTNSLDKFLQQYDRNMEEGEGSARIDSTEKCNSEGKDVLTIRELVEKVERDLGEPDIDQLNLTDLVQLEEQLEDALIQTRSRETHLLMESITGLSETEKRLMEENKRLQEKLTGSGPNEKRNVRIQEFVNLTYDGMICGEQQTTLKLL
ncbi:hypothetical protein ACH5RR_035454 [Cinchona calisaya]|uniref:Uncharacterized protein n=1 Tax=Cinchona calisaya TaxID=153742 RepID=A0ABD2Y2M0_9GENT